MGFSFKLFNKSKENNESSNCFFHFTKKIEHLINIMNNNFMPFYCMEGLEYLNMPDLQIEGMAYPIVCFCDIPLERHKTHKNNYGDYGIGLKKEWGINRKHHLTPVIYSHKESVSSASLKNLMEFWNKHENILSEEDNKKFKNAVSTLMMHFKPYEGFLYDKDKKQFSLSKVRFYDEKEWRYIPLNCNGLKLNLEMQEYCDEKILTIENEAIQKQNKMIFQINDLEYIFLKSKSEIELFLSRLDSRYSDDDIKSIRKLIIIDK